MKKIEWENYQDGDSTPLNAENLNLMQDNIEEEFGKLLNFFYPIGTIYETTSANLDTTTKMATHFGGTWERYGNGRVTVAMGGTSFDTIGKEVGEETHTLTTAQIPSHQHTLVNSNPGGGTSDWTTHAVTSTSQPGFTHNVNTNTIGGGKAHNNIQPSIVVYRYRRIA